MFKINVEDHPKSANVYNSLGEAYMINGDKNAAIENYKKSLELNPNNGNAREMLKRLQEK
jgi:tetratricopeptide (TPR) repeat protein